MAKVNYRTCDICGDTLKTDIRCRGFINGYRIWNRLFNKLDICNKCMKKIQLLSIDKRDEQKYLNKLIDNLIKYSKDDCQSAYCEGFEDALSVLSHRRLCQIKINKMK